LNNAKIISKIQARQLINQDHLVFVSGSFDLLHPGHQNFLQEAKMLVGEQGKLLVVVLNDAEIRRRKGADRPKESLSVRMANLAKEPEVDYILAWPDIWEKIPEFFKEIKPEYLALVAGDPGSENKQKIAAELGIKLRIFSKYQDFSTTKLISDEKQ